MQKLCLSAKFPHQKISWNYSIFLQCLIALNLQSCWFHLSINERFHFKCFDKMNEETNFHTSTHIVLLFWNFSPESNRNNFRHSAGNPSFLDSRELRILRKWCLRISRKWYLREKNCWISDPGKGWAKVLSKSDIFGTSFQFRKKN